MPLFMVETFEDLNDLIISDNHQNHFI